MYTNRRREQNTIEATEQMTTLLHKPTKQKYYCRCNKIFEQQKNVVKMNGTENPTIMLNK